MAPANPAGNMPNSSPPSSDQMTTHDTPSTVLTAHSTEQIHNESGNAATRAKPKFKYSITTGVHTYDAAIGSNSKAGAEGDVFLNAGPSSFRSQLSPTAEAFTPSQMTSTHVPTTSVGSVTAAVSSHTVYGATNGIPSASGSVSPIYTDVTGAIGEVPVPPPAPMKGPSGLPRPVNNPFPFKNVIFKEGTFTADDHIDSRAFIISNVHPAFDISLLVSSLTQFFPTFIGINCSKLITHGILGVSFGDPRDCREAMEHLGNHGPQWTLHHTSPVHFAVQFDTLFEGHVSDYEGQVKMIVGFTEDVPADDVMASLKGFLGTIGEVKAIATIGKPEPNRKVFRVEFYDKAHADAALNEHHRQYLRSPANISVVFESCASGPLPRPWFPPLQQATGPVPAARPQEIPSLTGRTMIPATPQNLAMQAIVRNNLSQMDHGRRQEENERNQVVPERIALGLDVRTTIMLRNIPNRITSTTLKEILDQTNHGEYDFMYLRIDFGNNCNVGYAFINFTHPEAIIRFYRARANQKWGSFQSDKVAQISYATIQGRENLVAKFRNSSVLCERPEFRPKLFTAGHGPDAGREESFPPPDNLAKQKRSLENAQHIGLYPPRYGSANRQDRRRGSQYDRGSTHDQVHRAYNQVIRPRFNNGGAAIYVPPFARAPTGYPS